VAAFTCRPSRASLPAGRGPLGAGGVDGANARGGVPVSQKTAPWTVRQPFCLTPALDKTALRRKVLKQAARKDFALVALWRRRVRG